jgi:hypothetical protein
MLFALRGNSCIKALNPPETILAYSAPMSSSDFRIRARPLNPGASNALPPLGNLSYESRGAQSFDLDLATKLIFPNGQTSSVRLLRLSATGLTAQFSDWLELGMEVIVTVPALGDVKTEVVYQTGTCFGGEFATRLTIAQFFRAGLHGRELSMCRAA